MRKWQVIWVIVAVIAADLLTKSWVSHALYLGEVLPVFPGFNLTLAHNTGAAFSFLADEGGWQRLFLSGLAILVSVGLTVWLMRTPQNQYWTRGGLSLLLGGAVGNLVDRLYYGYVVDFIDVYVGLYHWPAFNLADSAICVGAGLLFIGTKES